MLAKPVYTVMKKRYLWAFRLSLSIIEKLNSMLSSGIKYNYYLKKMQRNFAKF